MRPESATLALALVAASALGACRTDGEASTTQTTSHVLEPEPTAVDQSNAPEDVALLGEIRRRLVATRALSIGAKNLVVIVNDGVVTLRGEVPTVEEHHAVIAKVVSVPGVVRTDDRIAVKE